MTDIHPIRSDDDLASAIAEIDSLWDAPAGSPERDRLDVLSILVEAYDRLERRVFRASCPARRP